MSDATILTNPAPLSSVRLESRAKGPPTIEIKVYAASAQEAADEATRLYDALLRTYAEDAA